MCKIVNNAVTMEINKNDWLNLNRHIISKKYLHICGSNSAKAHKLIGPMSHIT